MSSKKINITKCNQEPIINAIHSLDGIYQLLGKAAPSTAPTPTASPTPVSTSSPTTPSPLAPPTTATSTTTASPAPKPAKPSRSRSGDTAQKIHQIVDAMIRWNSSQQDNQHRLRISIPPVKALASALGANYQATIQQVLGA